MSNVLQTEGAVEAGSDTRQRVLDAAEALFAEHGFRGASVREITQGAGCNLAAVNYHFGGKANLYRDVVLRRLTLLRAGRIAAVDQTMEQAGADASVELLLQAFTTAFLEPLVESSAGRRWVNLMSREMLDPQLPHDLFYNEMVVPMHKTLVAALCRLAPGLTADTAGQCVESLIAQLVHIERRHRWLERAAGTSAHACALPNMVAHTVRFTAAGVRALACAEGSH